MKEQLFKYIEQSEALAVELETELCKRPAVSPESGGEGELDKAEFLQAWLRDQGLVNLERFDAPDARAKGGVRPNLAASIPGLDDGNSSAPRLWIISHLDVVPPGEASLWQSDPWQVIRQGPRIIGRGVEDNQQGLVSSTLAALALIKLGITPPHTVKLLFAADEEAGSAYGVLWLIKQIQSGAIPELFRPNDMVLIPDGGDPQGETIEIAEKNLIWARFVTQGRQVHGSRPDQGINAHLAGAELAVKLHDGLSERFSDRDSLFEPDYSTFQPTKKEANVPNINTIPGEDVFCMDMRILPRYSNQEVLAEIDRIKAAVEAKYRVNISYTTPQAAESRPTPPDAPLIAFLAKTVKEVYGVKTRLIGIGGGTVAAPLRNRGIAAAVWSRMDDTAHQPNEYALIGNILGNAKVMALLMAGNLGQ
ncbi:MAG: M20 family metallo-hydrolase [Treponema sp.]|jgi:succinyl-diaminopimelate desuccinylase|nr:M20 family metallo-hydrolase [Treponema sp.]